MKNKKLFFTLFACLIIALILNETNGPMNYLIPLILTIISLYYANNVIKTEFSEGPVRVSELILFIIIIGVLIALLLKYMFEYKFDEALLKSIDVLADFMGAFTIIYVFIDEIKKQK